MDFGTVAVGVVEDGLITIYFFYALAVQIDLMAAFFGVYRSFLDLNDGKRLARPYHREHNRRSQNLVRWAFRLP